VMRLDARQIIEYGLREYRAASEQDAPRLLADLIDVYVRAEAHHPCAVPVRDFNHLDALARERRAVTGWIFKKPTPAAWVANMNAGVVSRMIAGGLYVYEKRAKR